jgi:hypothetical protein
VIDAGARQALAKTDEGRLETLETRQEMPELVEKQAVTRHVERVRLGEAALTVGARRRSGIEIHANQPGVSSHFVDSLLRTPHEVLMQLHGKRAAVGHALHQDTRSVLDIHVQRAHVPAERKDAPRKAEQRVRAVQIVDLREDHAASLVAP